MHINCKAKRNEILQVLQNSKTLQQFKARGGATHRRISRLSPHFCTASALIASLPIESLALVRFSGTQSLRSDTRVVIVAVESSSIANLRHTRAHFNRNSLRRQCASKFGRAYCEKRSIGAVQKFRVQQVEA